MKKILIQQKGKAFQLHFFVMHVHNRHATWEDQTWLKGFYSGLNTQAILIHKHIDELVDSTGDLSA